MNGQVSKGTLESRSETVQLVFNRVLLAAAEDSLLGSREEVRRVLRR